MQERHRLYTASDSTPVQTSSSHARLDETIVGHVPHEKSHVVLYFTEHDGIVTCQVTN